MLHTNLPKTHLSELYSPELLDRASNRTAHLATRYHAEFGACTSLRWFSAPGRTEIGGNHTDHQQGCVLAAAVSLDAIAAVSPNGDNNIRIYSEGYPKAEVTLDDLTPREEERNSSSGLIRGVAEYFHRHGWPIGGFNAITSNDVPGGSGLSSSASFEVLVGTILNGLFQNGSISPVDIAKAGQYAENVHFGKPCGLMDQTASAVGGVSSIDFKAPDSPVVKQIPFNFSSYGYALCIIDTGAYHNDLGEDYASIPQEMFSVAQHLGVTKLREASPAAFYDAIPALIGKVSDRAILRAMHFYADNDRATLEADALQRGDIKRFLQLINESGQSSWMLLQNIYPSGSGKEQPASLALAYCKHLLAGDGACRIHGGGFAGTIQAFVPFLQLETFRTEMEKVTGIHSCHVLSIRNVGSTEIILS